MNNEDWPEHGEVPAVPDVPTDSEPEEDPEEDPEEEPMEDSEDDPMHSSEEEVDPYADSQEEDGDSDDAPDVPDQDVISDDHREASTDDGEDLIDSDGNGKTVTGPTAAPQYRIRIWDYEQGPPPPSRRLYRSSRGGPVQMWTRGKSVRPSRKLWGKPLLSPERHQRPRLPPTWGPAVQDWSEEAGLPSTFEIGESSQTPSSSTPETPADLAMPAVVGRVLRHDHRIDAIHERTVTLDSLSQDIMDRVRSLEEDRNLDEEAIGITRDELADTRQQLTVAETQITTLSQHLEFEQQQRVTDRVYTSMVRREHDARLREHDAILHGVRITLQRMMDRFGPPPQ